MCIAVTAKDMGMYWYTLNKKKSLNGQGKSMVTVLRRKFLVQWGNLQFFMILLPVFHLMIPYLLDTLQLTQEKEKISVAQWFYWVIQKNS